MNKVFLLGRIGNDPEVKYMADGSQVASFSLATSSVSNRNGEKKETTEWHRCAAFGRTAEIAGQYAKKGTQVLIVGAIKTTKYKDKDGQERTSTGITVNELTLLGKPVEKKPYGSTNDPESEDIPF